MPTCPRCGQENPDGFRLCGMCGAALAEPTGPREVRKTVTVLFADVVGYTAAGERLDPEALRRLQSRYFEESRAALERHGATVEKFIGDAVMAVFGIPELHEDDALRAVRGAIDLQDAVAALGLRTRVGVNSGEVVAGSGDALVTGDAVNVAARLEQAAQPGEVLVGEETYALVRDAVRAEPLERLALQGKRELIPAFRLLAVVPGVEGRARRLDAPLVGRGDELRLLRDAYSRARRERACHLVTVLGAAGVGKSRLVEEFLAEIDDATLARGRCLAYGEGITYWPAAEAVREAVGIGEGDSSETARRRLAETVQAEPRSEAIAQHVAEAIGLAPGSAATEETFWAFRKLLEAVARKRPLVLALDDIQWGEPTFLDLVEHVADWARDAPVLLLCMARPDLLDARPAWAGGKLNATTFLLEPLAVDETERLISNLLAGELAIEAADRIMAAAEGNPLFVEELVGMLVEDGVLSWDNGAWSVTGDLEAVEVPPTIRALLSARLDRLPDDERVVIEPAAVEGQVFHVGAVSALAPEAGGPVPTRLMSLVRRELIRADRPVFADEDAFRFRHLLIRDAAYDALPKEARAELHERYAKWLEEKAGQRATEHAEILGYHLEQAHAYRSELSPADEQASVLAGRAGSWLRDAGLRALAHGDAPGAVSLLERAARLVPPAERVELLPTVAAALDSTGRIPDARSCLREAVELARVSGNRRIEWRALMHDAWWRLNADRASPDEIEPLAREAIRALEQFEDDDGLAHAWRVLSDVHNGRGEGAAWVDGMARAFRYARRAGDREQQISSAGILGGAMFFGPTPAAEAIERLRAMREEVAGDVILEASVERPLGGFVALQGRIDEGRDLVDRARAVFSEFGAWWMLAGVPFMSGAIEWLAGDLEAAEREYRSAYELYEEAGESGRRSSIAVELARVLSARGQLDEAETLADLGVELAAPGDLQPQAASLAVRGNILAARGRIAEAESRLREALVLLEAGEFLNQTAQARLDLAEVLERAGRIDEAVEHGHEALALYERKGNLVMAKRARELLGRLT